MHIAAQKRIAIVISIIKFDVGISQFIVFFHPVS